MLNSLVIKNVVLIQNLEVSFSKGLTVLTGQTGAGKSILLDSLMFLLGSKADTSLIRYGENQMQVYGDFSLNPNHPAFNVLENLGIEQEETISIRRILTKEGKSKAYINDTPVNVGTLKVLGEYLAEIHSQFSTHKLLNPNNYLSILDSYGHLNEKSLEVRACYQKWQNAILKAKNMFVELENAKKEEAYIQESIAEIEKINPKIGEENEIALKRNALMNKSVIAENITNAYHLLQGERGILKNVALLEKYLEKASELSGNGYANLLEMLEGVQINLSEIENSLNLEELPQENLEFLDDRLFALKDLARKYKVNTDELPEFLMNLKKQLENISLSDSILKKLNQEEKELESIFMQKAKALSSQRKKIAQELDKVVNADLPNLKLKNAEFETEIQNIDANENGIDRVIFKASTNSGMPLAPIYKIASGGELSRFMLVLKVHLAKAENIETIIFDEIDSGVGGAVAESVGKHLKKLSSVAQVMVITHAAQVASFANTHLVVQKESIQNITTASIQILNETERIKEVARMLSGENITENALLMAQEMIKENTAC